MFERMEETHKVWEEDEGYNKILKGEEERRLGEISKDIEISLI